MERAQRSRRGGFTLIELLIVIAIIVVLISAAAPKFSQYLMNARETAAMSAIRTIHTAQTQYNSQFGRFAATLAELGPPAGGQEGPGAADLIPSDLATGIKGGYKFVLETTPTGYRVLATPVAFNRDGRRSFYSDQTMVLRQNWGADPATATSPEMQ
ncbi:MAG: prepilin-type N-terminal cleavage/methylation domain-containing protein [Bryobacterales bacterium]|jgi:prepilin-type N-terminal cleavage/methylation domain-containing protein|nr:prepilin-type N-terminal cleavage/methylation domain-containing protein [Bryobacterales bacterium]